MKTENVWITNNIVRFFSDKRQKRLSDVVNGLKTLVAQGNKAASPPVESAYNYLFEEIFPKPDVVPKMWQNMQIEEKMKYLSSAAVIYTLYKRAWNSEPRFIPGFIKKIVRMI